MDIRALINRRLRELGHSPYWLAEAARDKPSRNAVYSYLRGDSDMGSAGIGRLLDLLDLQIAPRDAAPRQRP